MHDWTFIKIVVLWKRLGLATDKLPQRSLRLSRTTCHLLLGTALYHRGLGLLQLTVGDISSVALNPGSQEPILQQFQAWASSGLEKGDTFACCCAASRSSRGISASSSASFFSAARTACSKCICDSKHGTPLEAAKHSDKKIKEDCSP